MAFVKIFHKKKLLKLVLIVAGVFSLLVSPQNIFADNTDLLGKGDIAVQDKDFVSAEKIFSQALKNDPENYRILWSLAQAKVELKKFKEADVIMDKVLAMKVANGRDVLVTLADGSGPFAAELVDEIVVPADDGKNNMQNYLDARKKEPVPHYRLFFKKEGKMKLIPSSEIKLAYDGVLRRVYEYVQFLSAKVKKQLLAEVASNTSSEMVAIKGGCFQMGSNNGDLDEKPVHEVCLSPFKLDKYEVTQTSFQKVMGTNPSLLPVANHPVDNVTWYEARDFCKKVGKRLPTEAEFEYAIRGGTTTEYYWGDKFDGTKGNFCDTNCTLNIRDASVDDGYKNAAPVGSFPPNPLGLYDMAGNVKEWLNDFILENYYELSPKKDPKGPKYGERRLVVRGGGWNSLPYFLRSAKRRSYIRDYRNDGVGFRCASNQ
jgi:sulfatase modifying factor 1